MTVEQKRAVQQIAQAAVACEQATGCPAEISMAQCIFESAYLSKSPGHNCFGIKAHAATPKWQLVATHEWFADQEVARFLAGDTRRTATLAEPEQKSGPRRLYNVQDVFAAYDSLQDCFVDHARIIQSGVYADAWHAYQTDRDVTAYIAGVAAHYATDPRYKEILTSEAACSTVQNALRALRPAPPVVAT